MRNWRSLTRKILAILLAVVILGGAAVSLIPLLESNAWWVRYADFLRIQAAIVLAVSILLYLVVGGGRSGWGIAIVAAGVAGIGYHAYRLYPFTGAVEPMAVATATCSPGDRLRILVANVQKSNETRDPLLAAIASHDPDLILLLETDAWWDEAIEPLANDYPQVVQQIPETAQAFGMHILSRFPLTNKQVEFWFDADTPTIRADVELPSGRVAGFTGLHPRPPLYWSQPTTIRDGHMLQAAIEAAQSETPTIIAGDFNATPWERISRRAMRIGGLLDPRVGRGFYPTYDAQSAIMAWPLDQILFQPDLSLVDFERLPAIDSDHYPVRATLCFAPDLADRQSPPPPTPDDMAEARASIEQARNAP